MAARVRILSLVMVFTVFMKVKVKSLSRVRLFVTPWTVAYQTPPSMGFSRQEYWSGLPFPSPGDLPDPGIEPRSPALQADPLTSEPPDLPIVIFKPCQWSVGALCPEYRHEVPCWRYVFSALRRYEAGRGLCSLVGLLFGEPLPDLKHSAYCMCAYLL